MFQALGILFLGILLGLLIEWLYTALFVPSSKDKNKKLEEALHIARKENASLQRWIQKLQGAEAIPSKTVASETAVKKSEETVTELSGTVSDAVNLPVVENVTLPVSAASVPTDQPEVETTPQPDPVFETKANVIEAIETNAASVPADQPEVETTPQSDPVLETEASVIEAKDSVTILEPTEVVSVQPELVTQEVQAEEQPVVIQAEIETSALSDKLSEAEISQPEVSAEEKVVPVDVGSVEESVTLTSKAPAVVHSNEAPVLNPSSDFTKIHGIGPKLAELFKEAGITTYKQLANMDIGQIDKLFADNSMLYNRAVAVTWPQQAKLAEAGDWSALRKFKASRKK